MSIQKENELSSLLSRQETANYLKISNVTLWRWTKTGLIPSHSLGGRVYYKMNEVLNSLIELKS